jgi:histidinol-phosphatase (PHP family)
MSQFIDYTYHSHTKRCGHAVGEDEDYAKYAIKGHYQLLGYSDHVMLPHCVQPGMRGAGDLLPDYIQSVRFLQGKYQKQLQIYLAFECEWYGSEFASFYHDLLANQGFDYLLLGQHCFRENGRFVFYGDVPDKHEALERYTADLLAGIHSGLFAYVCHPDLFMIWYPSWDLKAEESARKIIAAAKAMGMPLEVNMGPSRWARRNAPGEEMDVPYPDPNFWDLVAEMGAEVIVGVDDHNPKELLTSDFAWVEDFVKKHSLRYVNRLNLVKK